MPASQGPSSGVGLLDTLIDGVRVGDNLVVVFDPDVPDEWLIDAFVAAADPGRLIVVDAVGRHRDEGSRHQVLDWSGSGPTAGPDPAREQLAAADRRVGSRASFAIDSLSAIAASWGEQAALDLFLWACPRLFRRGSIALWVVDATHHGEAFVRRLTDVTQVVVAARATVEGLQLDVVKADGRSEAVVGRSLVARLTGRELEDARPVGAERRRLGERLRALREARGVGQSELARRVGITPSALSQAERGVRGVSAETLMRIWEALGLPIGPEALDQGYRIHRRGERPSRTLAPGVTGHLRSEEPPLTVWQVIVGPRAAGRHPLFAAKAVETVVVVRGVLRVELDGRAETIHEGDTLVAETATVTAWSNPADRPAEALWLLVGSG